MNKPVGQAYDDEDDLDGPPMGSEADIRASLERSTADIAAGRVFPWEDVLRDLDERAERIRAERAPRT